MTDETPEGADAAGSTPDADRDAADAGADTPFGPVDAVCFDLDDTLFDYTQYIEAGLREAATVIESHTGEDYADELVDLYFEEDLRHDTFDHLLEREGLDDAENLPDDLVGQLVEAYHDHDATLTPYDAADDVLSALDDAFRLGIVTDGRNGRWKLAELGFEEYFDAVVVAPEHDLTKREAEPFHRALDDMGVAPQRTTYVGDNPRTDFLHPNRLGMTTVRLARGRYVDRDPASGETPDVVVESLERLPDLLNVPVDATR